MHLINFYLLNSTNKKQILLHTFNNWETYKKFISLTSFQTFHSNKITILITYMNQYIYRIQKRVYVCTYIFKRRFRYCMQVYNRVSQEIYCIECLSRCQVQSFNNLTLHIISRPGKDHLTRNVNHADYLLFFENHLRQASNLYQQPQAYVAYKKISQTNNL